jgi:hypothetical protein
MFPVDWTTLLLLSRFHVFPCINIEDIAKLHSAASASLSDAFFLPFFLLEKDSQSQSQFFSIFCPQKFLDSPPVSRISCVT